MTHIIEKLKEHMVQKQSDFGDGGQVLTILYEAYLKCDRMDDAQIKAYLNCLYRNMNGITLRDDEKGCGFRRTLRYWVGLQDDQAVQHDAAAEAADLLQACLIRMQIFPV